MTEKFSGSGYASISESRMAVTFVALVKRKHTEPFLLRNISCRTASYPCWANTSALKHGICTNLPIIIRMAYGPARPA